MPTLIDPQQIYPKRIGMYRGSLVVEYYNLETDCFKKHLIPYNNSQSTDKIIQTILKNPKHSVFVRKIPPHYLKQAISGRSVNLLPQNINQRSHSSHQQYISNENSRSNGTGSRENEHSQYTTNSDLNSNSNSYSYSYGTSKGYSGQGHSSDRDNSNSYNRGSSYTGSSLQPSSQNSQPSGSRSGSGKDRETGYGKWDSFKKKQIDQSGSYNLSTSRLSGKKDKQRLDSNHNLDESHGYSMNFDQESMNISVVPMKEPQKKQHIVQQEMDYYQQDFEQLSGQKLQINKQKQKKIQQKKPAKEQQQKQKPKQKQKQKSKRKKQQMNQFQFLDEEQPKKKKKKKKEKSKQKQKQKSKSNNTSQNISKQSSVKQQIPIQEQFDFI